VNDICSRQRKLSRESPVGALWSRGGGSIYNRIRGYNKMSSSANYGDASSSLSVDRILACKEAGSRKQCQSHHRSVLYALSVGGRLP